MFCWAHSIDPQKGEVALTKEGLYVGWDPASGWALFRLDREAPSKVRGCTEEEERIFKDMQFQGKLVCRAAQIEKGDISCSLACAN